jgi:hypothetical protein
LGIDDVQNGVLLNAAVHRMLAAGWVAFLKVRNCHCFQALQNVTIFRHQIMDWKLLTFIDFTKVPHAQITSHCSN